MPYSTDAWKRLGREVYAARVRAGYRETEEWAGRVGRSSRILLGLERGERTGKGTLTLVEEALDWPTGRTFELLNESGVAHSVLPAFTQDAAGAVRPPNDAKEPAGRTPPALSVVPAIVTSPLDDEDDEDNPVLKAIRDDPDLDDIGRDHFASQYKILRKFAQYRREVERLPYVAHGQREEPVDEAEEARIEDAARRAALENPHSPTNDPGSPEGHK